MARLLVKAFCVLALAAAYIGLPFWTAFSIREAVKTGDTAFLEAKVEWRSVRETMRQSLTAHALDLPETEALEAGAAPASRGLWQRVKDSVKSYAGRRVVDTFVDSYVTPAGLSQMYEVRRMYREKIKGEADDAITLPRFERMKRAWARVKRAEFLSLTAFEIEMQDRFNPERSYVGLLELRGIEWKLSELRVRARDLIAPVAYAR